MRQNARKSGLILGALMLAVLMVGMVALVPGPVNAQDNGAGRLIQDPSGIRWEGSGAGKPVAPGFSSPAGGNILFEQPPTPPDQDWGGYTSDKNIVSGPYLCMEDFWGLTENIGGIQWYGFSLLYSSGWYDCDPTGMEFQIIFYQDSGGSPGAPVAMFSNISPTIAYYDTYYGFPVYRFEVADLGTPVSLTQGWVSIQSTSSPNGCAFLWLTSPTGNTNAIQEPVGSLGRNLAFALTGIPPCPPPPPIFKYLHAEDGLINMTDPVNTQWNELWPLFGREYHLSSWNDTSGDGLLSHSDKIDMYQKPNGEPRDYHVENVTITLFVTPTDKGPIYEPMYIELEGGYNASALTKPIGTQWQEVYPNFCTTYNLTDWYDDQNNGKLDSPDGILLKNKSTNVTTDWLVEDVAVDIVVTPEPGPVGGEAYPIDKISLLAPWIAVGLVLAGGSSWYVLKRRRAQS